MIKIKRDQIVGAISVILGIIILVMISGYSVPFSASYPGPKALPGIAAFGFIICGIGVFVEGTLSKKEDKPYMPKHGWPKMGLTVLVLCLYVLLEKYIGFVISTPIATFVLVTMFAKGSGSKLLTRIIFAVAVTIVIYVVYVVAFGMSLPSGILF